MLNNLWNSFVDVLIVIFMPLVCFYHTLCSDLFFNVAVENATGFEKAGNTLLAPLHYAFAGRVAVEQLDGSWKFVQRFDYTDFFWVKSAASAFSIIPGTIFGTILKSFSLLDQKTREKYASLSSSKLRPNLELYKSLGIAFSDKTEEQTSLGCQRRPGDELKLQAEKQALGEIATLFNEAKIVWWVDCGTCIGAYRYGGAIPWDHDVDVAVLLNDFDNVCHALKGLDPNKYIVQDWSSRTDPKSYLKVYVLETGNMIDIYHFKILPEKKQIQYLFALDTHMLFPEWFKIRERKFTKPVAFETVFPLKKMDFDGIEVFVPNDTKKYLQRCYGDDLAPVKIYDPITDNYEKDLGHPYWQLPYAH